MGSPNSKPCNTKPTSDLTTPNYLEKKQPTLQKPGLGEEEEEEENPTSSVNTKITNPHHIIKTQNQKLETNKTQKTYIAKRKSLHGKPGKKDKSTQHMRVLGFASSHKMPLESTKDGSESYTKSRAQIRNLLECKARQDLNSCFTFR